MNFECPVCKGVVKRDPLPGRKTVDSFCAKTNRNVRLRRTRRRLSK